VLDARKPATRGYGLLDLLVMPSRRQAAVELALWALAGSLWVLSSVLRWPLAVGIGAIVLALLGHGVWTWHRGLEGPRDLGLRTDNLRVAAGPILSFTVLVATLEVVVAVATGRPSVPRELLVLLPVYPLWGVAQELVVQGIIHRRLLVLWPSRWGAITLTALVFGLLHVADLRLLVLTTAVGVGWSWLFSRWPNVWLLGLSHGVLASLAYPLLLGQDPLAP
jgi:hypothetical protein